MESAVGSNPSVLSFLGFLCKGVAPSFWNTKSSPLVSWFPFFFVLHQLRQNEKEQNKNLARRVQGTQDYFFECAHFMYILSCRTAVRAAQFLKPMIS